MADQNKTNVQLIAGFFPFENAGQKMAEIKELSTTDREQLGEGIRNGTLTY